MGLFSKAKDAAQKMHALESEDAAWGFIGGIFKKRKQKEAEDDARHEKESEEAVRSSFWGSKKTSANDNDKK